MSEPKNSVGVITYVKAKGCFLIDLYRAGSVFTDKVLAPLVIRKIVVLRDICGGFTFQTQTLGQPIILSITLGKDNQHSIYKLLT